MRRLTAIAALPAIFAILMIACEKQAADIMDPDEFESSFLTAGAYNDYGYNYDAHLFNGSYFNAYAEEAGFAPYVGDDDEYLADFPDASSHWAWQYRKTDLLMKWDEAWLSKHDLDHDGKLDCHPGSHGYEGSGAWLTNHQSWWIGGVRYTYFVKIVAAGSGDTQANGYWYDPEGNLTGESIWGRFSIMHEVLTPGGAVFHPASPCQGKVRQQNAMK